MDVMIATFLLPLGVVSLIGLTKGQGGGAPPPQQPPPDECKYDWYEPRGTFESPGFPNGYPENSDCVYRIFSNQIIRVNFEAFSIEETRDCAYDYLQVIFEATSPTAAPDRYCGDGLDKIKGGELRGRGPLILVFRSDDSENLDGFKFNFEFEFPDPGPCESEPCQNGGTCLRMVGYYECDCVEGFFGQNCDVDWDECASFPCEHGGQCQDGPNNYTCECINGFTGDLCQNEPDPCASNPCQNGGLCTNRIPSFMCSCPRSFMGESCEEEVPTLPPPTTTLPPTTAPTTTPTPTPLATPETEAQESENQPSELKGEGDGHSEDGDNEVDPKEVRTPSNGDSSGATAAAVIMCFLALIMAALLAWFWLKQQRKNNDGIRREVTLVNMKTQSQKRGGKENKRTKSINVIHSNRNGKKSQLLDELHRLSRDIIMEEVGSEDDRNLRKSETMHNRTLRKEKARPHHKSTARLPSIGDDIPSHKEGPYSKITKGYNPKTSKNIDLSPEEAAEVLNQLLGKSNKRNINPKEAQLALEDLQARRHKPHANAMKRKNRHESRSRDVMDESHEKFKNGRYRDGRRRNIPNLPLHLSIQEEDFVSVEEDSHKISKGSSSTDLIHMKGKKVKNEKTLDPREKVHNWLRKTPPWKIIRSVINTNVRSKPNKMERDISLEDFEYDDGNSTTDPSEFKPRKTHQKTREKDVLPITTYVRGARVADTKYRNNGMNG